MRKQEYIERYGEEWYREYRQRCRAYNKKRYSEDEAYKEHLKEYRKQYPEALIFLTSEEHNKDYSKSTKYPLETKWHKRSLENE